MKRLLEQLDSIKAIVDTVSPAQIERDPQAVASGYQLYASAYDPIDQVKTLLDRLVAEVRKGKPVNGYLSAGFGYGKTATLVYLWQTCQQKQIVAVPPFKFKELGDLMFASYGWIRFRLEHSRPELIPQVETLYRKYGLKSQKLRASELAGKYKLSEDKALKIVQEDWRTDTTNTHSVLGFWQESIPLLREAGFAGLAVFADESQEFLRTEEGASVRIQALSDLVKGMRALGNTPVALILSMPTDPTESAIEEQAGDIIHRMKEQKVSLRLADVYNYEFPIQLWTSLCEKFLDKKSQGDQLAHPATIESLGQLCDRKDLSNGPRAVIEVFKRLVHFAQDNQRPYTPLDLIQDYLTGLVQLYGTEQHRISSTINSLEQLTSIQKHPKGRDVIKLLAIFPAGVSQTIAQEFGLLESLKELAEDGNLYGQHITQPTSDRFALVSLSETQTSLTVLDEILNRFRQRWFGLWDNVQKVMRANEVFQTEVMSLILPPSGRGQRANWTWKYKEWKLSRCGVYNLLEGAPERFYAEFPNRSLIVSIGTNNSGLMSFQPSESTHLDWRFYLGYEPHLASAKQKLTAITGTGQIDFYLQLGRSFTREYPKAFGLLRKVMAPEQCSACTLLNLSHYIQEWLTNHPEVSKADAARLEQHRRECHQYALQLLFPSIESNSLIVEGLEGVTGAETKLIESVFYQKCKTLFPQYESFYSSLRQTLLKYKLALEKVPLAARRSRQPYQAPKEEFEKLFETAGSGLPSVLSTFKQYSLISDEKIAGKKDDNSLVTFLSHPLEEFIQGKLASKGRSQTIETKHGRREILALDYPELWDEVQKLGYLREEFEEALEWLQRRRYVEWERQRGIIRQSVAELDSDDLEGQLLELQKEVTQLIAAFNDETLQELQQKINEAKTILNSNRDDEVILDRVMQIIQAACERIEGFNSAKRSALQQELQRLKLQIGNFMRDLNAAKVNQSIVGASGLEICLNDYRKHLEKQLNQLDRDCQSLANSIKAEETNTLALHEQVEHCHKSFKTLESTKKRLQPLVTGSEQWRVILTRAGALRENLVNDPDRLRRYNDDFVDRVVTHFATHQIESFKQYELLKTPLERIDEEINSERRSRREAFDQLLSKYEDLLGRVTPNERHLRNICRFDDEDRDSSYCTLRQVFLDKLNNWCSNKILECKELERELSFLAQEREQDVSELLSQSSDLQHELSYSRNELPASIQNLENLEQEITSFQYLSEKSQILRGELRKLQFYKDENLKKEEKQLLDVIDPKENALAISQLHQRISDDREIWESVKALYKKGHIEIIVRRRD